MRNSDGVATAKHKKGFKNVNIIEMTGLVTLGPYGMAALGGMRLPNWIK